MREKASERAREPANKAWQSTLFSPESFSRIKRPFHTLHSLRLGVTAELAAYLRRDVCSGDSCAGNTELEP